MDRSRRLASMFWKLDRLRHKQEQTMSLTSASIRILWLLSDGTPRSLKEISHQLRLEQSTANRQVNDALSHGLVERDREASNSPYLFTRSEAGRTAYESNIAISLSSYREALESLGESDAEAFLNLLDRYLTAFSEKVHVEES